MKQITLFIDADDTLWENNIYYEQCMADFVELMAAQGFEREEAKHTIEKVERERIPMVGYAPEEFARSLVIAYQRLCENHGQLVQDTMSNRVWEIGRAVLEYPIVLLEGVKETLAHLKDHHRLLLLTKGDREVQQNKVERSGLSHFFEAVHIVHEKDAGVFRDLVARYELQPQQTWMIGNSPRSDINPALEAGINAIYVPHPNTWELELEQVNNRAQVPVLNSFGELTGLFPGPGQNRSDRTMSQYTIRPHDPADNAGLAVMWNESDDQWPGTFTGGVPMTEEMVRDWTEKETCLMRLVAEDESDGSIVGYGTLWQSTSQRDTCYVSVLNVHPAHQKRSLARRMLTQMVDWASTNGHTRMTIGTWPGNLKSVPLYKKVGFFWVPDTDVFMENYVTAIRQLPVAQGYFERHDWYATYRRALEQVEDVQTHPATGNMKVYVLRWEEDGEFVEAVIDRQSQALCGLETEHFAAYAVVEESEPAQGIAYPIHWRVTNKRSEPVNVSVLANGAPGIELSHRSSFVLGAGEERSVEGAYTCTVDAPRLDAHEDEEEKPRAPKISTTLVVGGDVVELGTGLRYRPAVEFSATPEVPSLLPSQGKTILLQLQNHTQRPLSGFVTIAPQEGLTTDWLRREFEMDADGYAGLELTVTSDREGGVPLHVRATFTDADRQVTTAPQRVPLLVTPMGGVSADFCSDKLIIENDFFKLIGERKGGQCRVMGKARQRRDAGFTEEIGPPFEPWELYDKTYELAIEQGTGWAKAILTARSDRFPGLSIAREVTVTGSPLIQVGYRLVNSGATSHQVQIRPTVTFPDKDLGQIVMPHKERLVIERASEFPATEGDLPKKPELMAEQWIALSRDDQTTATVWNTDVVEHEFWWERLFLFFSERTVEPQSSIEVGPLYIYEGPGDWRNVRRVWQRTAGAKTQLPLPLAETDRPHAFRLSLEPLITLTDQVEATLQANSVRAREITGRLVIETPPGWATDRTEFQVEGLTANKPLEETLVFTATTEKSGATTGHLRLESEGFDEVRPFTLIRLGDKNAAVQVEESQKTGQPVWTVANGRCAWTLAPSFHGGLIGWREAGSDVNHLLTAFPDDGELGWLKPWYGGVHPMIMPLDREHGWPGKLHQETFTAAPYETTDENGILWRGVQVAASMQREEFGGLGAEIAYLTVGHSPVLKMVYRLVNETTIYRRLLPGLLTFCQVDGQYKDTCLYGEGYQRKRTPHTSWSFVGPWGAAVNPDTGRAIALIVASGERRAQVSDWGVDGGHLMAYNHVVLAPRSSYELVAYLALTESLEEARYYGAMGTGQSVSEK